jgi:hypothetical protein
MRRTEAMNLYWNENKIYKERNWKILDTESRKYFLYVIKPDKNKTILSIKRIDYKIFYPLDLLTITHSPRASDLPAYMS